VNSYLRRLLALAARLAGPLIGGTEAVAGVSPLASHAARVTTGISWKGCGVRLQCGRVRVPLDWARQHGPTISLAVIRYLPSRRAHRIGSLVVNFGGPGTAGVAALKAAPATMLEALSRERFDVVSWDPRGTGESTHVRSSSSRSSNTSHGSTTTA
jgi:pimeloyl-ACP methyl ester carboxylesterase